MDLFASRVSTHCSLFFSLGRDDPPLRTDTMAHQWPQGLLYAFPPFGLLPPLLQRIRIEEVRLVLIAPNWPHMVWFSDIPQLQLICQKLDCPSQYRLKKKKKLDCPTGSQM